MTSDPKTPPPVPPLTLPATGGAKSAAQLRQEREAAALRANLRKRKDQVRLREKPKQD